MHSVISTPIFLRQAERAGLTEEDITAIETTLASNPRGGAIVAGTGGARKLRIPRRGSGKSGGYRTIHYFGGDDVPIFLLAVFSKGDKANLSKAERNELAGILPRLADTYRAAVASRAKELRGQG